MRRLVAALASALLAAALLAGCGSGSSSGSSSGPQPDQGHRHHLQRRLGDAERRPDRRRGRPADRVRRHRRRARRDPRPLAPRSRSSSTTQGSSTIDVKPIHGTGRRHVESHTLNKALLILQAAVNRPPPARPRAGRRAGPADLPRARRSSARRPRSPSRSSSSSLAWRKPRYDAATSGRPAPAWLARIVDSARLPRPAPPGRAARPDLPRARRGPRQGPADQPDLRHLLRLDLGRHGRRLPALRAGLEGDQPVPPDQRRPGPASRAATRTTASSPTPSGSGCGRPPSACSRSSGWSWSTPTTSTSARSGCGARSTSPLMIVGGALFGNTLLRARRPVRGLLQPGRPAVGLGPPRRRPARDPQPAGQPRHHARPPRAWSRSSPCCSAVRRSTRSASRRGG